MNNSELMNINKFLVAILMVPLLYSCKVYKSNIMFKTNYDYVVDSIRKANLESDKNFVIARNDWISESSAGYVFLLAWCMNGN